MKENMENNENYEYKCPIPVKYIDNRAYNQAVNMAKFANITLDEEQIDKYIQARDDNPSVEISGAKKQYNDYLQQIGEMVKPVEKPVKESVEKKPFMMSDQELFNSVLNEEQSAVFKKKYPNIFPEEKK